MRRLLVGLLLLVVAAAGGMGLWFWSYLATAPAGRDEVVVVIPRGTGVRGIGAILAARGVLADDIRYLVLVHFTGLTSRLKAGEYSIPAGLTPPQVLQLLATGATLRHQVTVPEGLTVEQVAQIFADGGWLTIRFSGTEPVLRVFAEAETGALAEDAAARVARHLGLEG